MKYSFSHPLKMPRGLFHLWLWGCLTNWAGPFLSLSVVVRRRLRARVILYQEPFIAANAVFVMLYWSLRGEFVFHSGPARSTEAGVGRGGPLLSNTESKRRVKLITKIWKDGEGPARTNYWSTPGCIDMFHMEVDNFLKTLSLCGLNWPRSSLWHSLDIFSIL